jgi:hypothetical protein
MSTSLESLDTLYFEFNDLDMPAETTVRPSSEAILRWVFSQRPLGEQSLGNGWTDLARLLAIGREQELSCRQRGDRLGLACCLGNLALIHKAKGDAQAALELHREEADLYPQAGYLPALIPALLNQARLLAEQLNDAGAALALAEEAHRLATQPERTPWAAQTETALEALRQRGEQN